MRLESTPIPCRHFRGYVPLRARVSRRSGGSYLTPVGNGRPKSWPHRWRSSSCLAFTTSLARHIYVGGSASKRSAESPPRVRRAETRGRDLLLSSPRAALATAATRFCRLNIRSSRLASRFAVCGSMRERKRERERARRASTGVGRRDWPTWSLFLEHCSY